MDAKRKGIAGKPKIIPRVLRCICYATFLLFASCTTIHDTTLEPDYISEPAPAPEKISAPVSNYIWLPIDSGLSLAKVLMKEPPLAVYCLRVDLENSKVFVEVITSPGSPTLRRTSSVVRKHSLVAAVNASPFSPVQLFEGKNAYIAGLSVTDGKVISPSSKKYASLVIESNSRARVLSSLEAQAWEPGPNDNGCGGFSLLLTDSVVTYAEFENLFDSGRAPRTAAGTSDNGRYLYLMVIDGKNKRYSVGATFSETAHWIASFGANDALMLDGGGSSTLALRNEAGKVKLVNIPVQGIIPRIERPVANHIGIRVIHP